MSQNMHKGLPNGQKFSLSTIIVEGNPTKPIIKLLREHDMNSMLENVFVLIRYSTIKIIMLLNIRLTTATVILKDSKAISIKSLLEFELFIDDDKFSIAKELLYDSIKSFIIKYFMF